MRRLVRPFLSHKSSGLPLRRRLNCESSRYCPHKIEKNDSCYQRRAIFSKVSKGSENKEQESIRDILANVRSGNPADRERALEAFQRLVRDDALNRFAKWRKRHTVLMLGLGLLSGAGIMTGALFVYFKSYPSLIEKYVIDRTMEAFAKSLSFEGKMRVFNGLPEPKLPTQETLTRRTIQELVNKISEAEDTQDAEGFMDLTEALSFWSETVLNAFDQAESSWLLVAKNAMRGMLVKDLLKSNSSDEELGKNLILLREVLSDSLELDLLSDSLLTAEERLIPAEILNQHKPQMDPQACSILTRLVINAIAFFPGPLHKFISALHDDDERYIEGYERDVFPGENMSEWLELKNENGGTLSRQGFTRTLSADSESEEKPIKSKKFSLRKLKRCMTRSKQKVDFSDATMFSENLGHLDGFIRLKRLFKSLAPEMRKHVLETALTITISSLKDLPNVGDVHPMELYERAIDEGLVNSLRQDARISEDILKEVRTIFLSLPATVQSRILITAVTHPAAKMLFEGPSVATPAKHDPERDFEIYAELVRDLLMSGGVVAVKLGQLLAEHPGMPSEYQKLLGSLRENNQPMHLGQFWFSIPTAIRENITHLGSTLGTGSVKQVHEAIFKDHLHPDGYRVAVCVLRNGVEDEALTAVAALENSEAVGPVAKGLGRMVFGECNLFDEGEALKDFALTSIGTHPLFRVVKIFHHSPKCLVEEVARGESVANLLSPAGRALSNVKNLSKPHQEEVQTAINVLTEYHRAVFSAFVRDGLIHSDIHLGNAVAEKDENNQVKGFILFDVGQFERIDKRCTQALLWTILSIVSPGTRRFLKDVCISQLAQVSDLDASISAKIRSSSKRHNKLKELLGEAFDEAIELDKDGIPPEKKVAYILLLRNAERRGVVLPKGAFAVAKLVDSIDSQQDQYLLPSILETSTLDYLFRHITLRDTGNICKGIVKGLWPF